MSTTNWKKSIEDSARPVRRASLVGPGPLASLLVVPVLVLTVLAGSMVAATSLGAQPLAGKAAKAAKAGKAPRGKALAAAPEDIDLKGFGFGHGRGMGQWGAYGYAKVYGWDYERILAHFYGGARLGRLPTPEPDVTVHLTELNGHNAIASAFRGGSLLATWPGGAPLTTAAVEVARSGGEQAVLAGPGCAGPWHKVGETTSTVTIAATGSPASTSSSELQTCLPGGGRRTYQGYLLARWPAQTDNIVPLEDYVDGVVAAESPPGWASTGGEAALEAQAVAARSVAVALDASARGICDTAQCQVYRGVPSQSGVTADAAVSATAGQVLYCEAGSSCGPPGSVAMAEYSASTGGYTAGGLFPAVPDLGDSAVANPVHAWTAAVPLSRLDAAFPTVGVVEQVVVTKRNGRGQMGGRVEELEVVGSEGSVTLTGARFAASLGLDSNWFAVEGWQPTATVPATTTTTRAKTTTTRAKTTTTAAPRVTTTTTSGTTRSGTTTARGTGRGTTSTTPTTWATPSQWAKPPTTAAPRVTTTTTSGTTRSGTTTPRGTGTGTTSSTPTTWATPSRWAKPTRSGTKGATTTTGDPVGK